MYIMLSTLDSCSIVKPAANALVTPIFKGGQPESEHQPVSPRPPVWIPSLPPRATLSERLLRGCKDGLCDRVHLTLSSGAEDGEVVAVVSKEVGGEEERGARGGVPGHEH